jgi:hypothetical protein
VYFAPQRRPRVSIALVELVGQALIRIAIAEEMVEVGGVGQQRRFSLPLTGAPLSCQWKCC